MGKDRPRQSIGVIATLVGTQSVSAGVHLPMTDDAAVSVRIGSTLIYMHEPETVAKFVNACFDLASDARKLPREVASALVAPVRGMTEPGVVVNAFGSPPASGVLMSVAGQPSYLRLRVGRVLFEMRDQGAFSSVAAIFREAASLSVTAFPGAEVPFRRQTALQQAATAIPPSRSRRRVVPRDPVPRSARPSEPVRPAQSSRWTE